MALLEFSVSTRQSTVAGKAAPAEKPRYPVTIVDFSVVQALGMSHFKKKPNGEFVTKSFVPDS